MDQSSSREAHFLPPHVFACSTINGAVFLDLRANKYLGISAEDMERLGALVAGWPTSSVGHANEGPETGSEDSQLLAKSLQDRGLLTSRASEGKSASPPSIPPVESTAREFDSDQQRSLRLIHLTRFMKAYAYARLALRFSSLEKIIARLQDARANQRSRLSSGNDAPDAIEMTLVYSTLRSFVYQRSDNCLLDSFALLVFLNMSAIYPNWVFGVRLCPFEAHCWIQNGNMALNTSVEETREFTPIMII